MILVVVLRKKVVSLIEAKANLDALKAKLQNSTGVTLTASISDVVNESEDMSG